MANTIRYFAYTDRLVQIRFFDPDPVTVTVKISDENDAKIDGLAKALGQADDVEKKKAILSDLIGSDNMQAILSRTEEPDNFALTQLILFVQRSYFETRQKNLNAAASGTLK